MAFFGAKKDELFITQFRKDVMALWGIELQAKEQLDQETSRFRSLNDNQSREALRAIARRHSEYESIRERIAQGMPRAQRIAIQCGITTGFTSYPPPMIAGSAPVIQGDMLALILNDNTYGGCDKQLIKDTLDRLVGASEEFTRKKFWRLFNPFCWVLDAIAFLLRIPFMILEAAGFDGTKYEATILGKIAKLALLALYAIVFGFNAQEIKERILSLLGR